MSHLADLADVDTKFAAMQHTQADFKNELLFSKFGINYSQLDPRLRKVSLISVS